MNKPVEKPEISKQEKPDTEERLEQMKQAWVDLFDDKEYYDMCAYLETHSAYEIAMFDGRQTQLIQKAPTPHARKMANILIKDLSYKLDNIKGDNQ